MRLPSSYTKSSDYVNGIIPSEQNIAATLCVKGLVSHYKQSERGSFKIS